MPIKGVEASLCPVLLTALTCTSYNEFSVKLSIRQV